MDQDWQILSIYTREQAIEDGVLIDVTEAARKIGFKVNTCVTDHLYGEYLSPPADVIDEDQCLEGRLTDLLFKTLIAAKNSGAGSRVEFEVLFQMSPGEWSPVKILAVMGPGDHHEPVLTIMLPEDE